MVKNHKWTDTEENALRRGIEKYGTSAWMHILKDNEISNAFESRSNVNLKDKYINMKKSGYIVVENQEMWIENQLNADGVKRKLSSTNKERKVIKKKQKLKIEKEGCCSKFRQFTRILIPSIRKRLSEVELGQFVEEVKEQCIYTDFSDDLLQVFLESTDYYTKSGVKEIDVLISGNRQFARQRVPGDGRCLFRSVLAGLLEGSLSQVTDLLTDELRLETCEAMRLKYNEGLIENLHFYFEGKEPLKYIEDMKVFNAWGGHQELLILADLKQVCIRVWVFDDKESGTIMESGLPSGLQYEYERTINILFIGGTHYDCLRELTAVVDDDPPQKEFRDELRSMVGSLL